MTLTPYLSMKGLAFKEQGTAMEITWNIRIALERIRHYVNFGGCSHDAENAIKYIERVCPKVETITHDMRMIILDDNRFPDTNPEELKQYRLKLCNDLDKRTCQKSPRHNDD